MVDPTPTPEPAGFRESELVLLSDQPVGDDGQRDLLARSVAARQLADLIRASRGAAPFALAVYADWGMGKSSMLSQVEAEFRDTPDVKTVWFNAWTANRGDALETLIKSVLGQLDPSALRRLARRFGGESGLGAWTRILLRGAAGAFRLHHLVDEIWKQLAVDARLRNEARDQLSKVLREWTRGDGRAPDGRMIVVFVDDLDRCPADVIGVVCDAVKQYLSVPGLVFVLGCDQAVIESSVMLAPAGQSAATIGRRYLEKIIQASYSIPVPTDEDAAQLVEGYARQSGTQALFQGAVAEAVTRHASRNPRRIKRLINKFVIEYRLDPQWRQFGADALIRVILLQDLYPEFYALLARTEDLDPIDEFTEYHWLCSLSGGRPDEDARRRVEAILTEHEIAWPALAESGFAVTEDLVARVERELPPVYLTLARDKTFVGLAAELAESAENEAFRARLRRRRAVGAIPAYSGDVAESEAVAIYARGIDPYDYPPPPDGLDLSTLTIVWISDKPEDWRTVLGFAGQHGARINWVRNGQEALTVLATAPSPCAVMTNITREYSRDGGFDDLEFITSQGEYTGPLIIYTSFVSASRAQKANELGARITSRQSVALGWLAELTHSAAGAGFRVLVLCDDDPPDIVHVLERQAEVRAVTALGSAFSRLRREGADAVVIAHRQYAPGMIEHIAETLRVVFDGPILVYGETEFSEEEEREAREHGAQTVAGSGGLIGWFAVRHRHRRAGQAPDTDSAAVRRAGRAASADDTARFQRLRQDPVTRSDGRPGNPARPGAD